tara:strand:- start:174 stop:434 length:261 start_codon:yes stop_codon:yes gene_type:complete
VLVVTRFSTNAGARLPQFMTVLMAATQLISGCRRWSHDQSCEADQGWCWKKSLKLQMLFELNSALKRAKNMTGLYVEPCSTVIPLP